MQRCHVTVRLGGDILSTVIRTNVSPAEIAILRHIHGDDAVLFMRHDGDDRGRQDVNEKDRLSQLYGADRVRDVFGVTGKMPERLADVGITDEPEAEAAEPVARRGRPAKAKPEADTGVTPVTADDLGTAFEPAE